MFDDLKKERERYEEAQRELQERKAEQDRLEKLPETKRMEAHAKFDGMVTEVLEALRQALYPSEVIRGWTIGYWFSWETTNDSFAESVSVTLIFGGSTRDAPACFLCKCLVKYQAGSSWYESYCGLSESELVETLRPRFRPKFGLSVP